MKSVEYRFKSNWRVEAAVEEVFEILSSPLDFVRWWPEVYLDVELIKPGDDSGLGEIVRLRTKGRLPYHLNWEAETLKIDKPNGMTIGATGDLKGEGIWRFTQDGDFANIHYDWTVVPRIPFGILTPFLKPVFESNHHWAMCMGENGLVTELEKTRHEGNEL